MYVRTERAVMRTVKVFTAVMILLLLAANSQAGVSLVMNGSFENDGLISDIALEAPRRWCDVNVPAGKFGGWIDSAWDTHGDYSLSLYSEYGSFAAGDMVTVSQQVYLEDAEQIIFDLRLGTVFGYTWDPAKRSALILIDGNIVWDSDELTPNISDEYLNQIVDVDEIYRDANSHTLSLALSVDETGSEWFYRFLAQWDFVKFDTYCGGFGYLPEDLNLDCYVDMLDLKLMSEQWLAEELNLEYDLYADHDLIINLPDFATFAFYWQDQNCAQLDWCRGSDFDRSGAVDYVDLMIFADHWLGDVIYLLSDLSGNDFVNFADFASLADSWQHNTDSMNWQDENCFELGLPAGDLDYDGIVNLRDFAILAGEWDGRGPCLKSDIDDSQVIDNLDIKLMTEEWLVKSWLYGLE